LVISPTTPYIPDRGHIVKFNLGEPAIFTVKSVERIISLSSSGMSYEDIAKALNNDIKNQGREQSGYRPLLVLSPFKYNQMSSLFLACPITSNSKGLRFEVQLPEALTTRGFVLSDQFKTLDWVARKVKYVESVLPELVEDVQSRIEALIL